MNQIPDHPTGCPAEAAATSFADRPAGSHAWRLLLAGLGMVCVGLAALGALLPGLPTTVFLLLASYFFAKSCPWLEDRYLRRNRLFKPYLALLDSDKPLPWHARLVSMLVMWGVITVSILSFQPRGPLGAWFTFGMLAAGGIGSVAILLFRRGRPVHAPQDVIQDAVHTDSNVDQTLTQVP